MLSPPAVLSVAGTETCLSPKAYLFPMPRRASSAQGMVQKYIIFFNTANFFCVFLPTVYYSKEPTVIGSIIIKVQSVAGNGEVIGGATHWALHASCTAVPLQFCFGIVFATRAMAVEGKDFSFYSAVAYEQSIVPSYHKTLHCWFDACGICVWRIFVGSAVFLHKHFVDPFVRTFIYETEAVVACYGTHQDCRGMHLSAEYEVALMPRISVFNITRREQRQYTDYRE